MATIPLVEHLSGMQTNTETQKFSEAFFFSAQTLLQLVMAE
jgi:hypothetical protein